MEVEREEKLFVLNYTWGESLKTVLRDTRKIFRGSLKKSEERGRFKEEVLNVNHRIA